MLHQNKIFNSGKKNFFSSLFNENSAIIVWELRISGTFPENTFPYTN